METNYLGLIHSEEISVKEIEDYFHITALPQPLMVRNNICSIAFGEDWTVFELNNIKLHKEMPKTDIAFGVDNIITSKFGVHDDLYLDYKRNFVYGLEQITQKPIEYSVIHTMFYNTPSIITTNLEQKIESQTEKMLSQIYTKKVTNENKFDENFIVSYLMLKIGVLVSKFMNEKIYDTATKPLCDIMPILDTMKLYLYTFFSKDAIQKNPIDKIICDKFEQYHKIYETMHTSIRN